MKEKQTVFDIYTDLIDEPADPKLVQLVRELDGICRTPQPPARVNWTSARNLYAEQKTQKKAALLSRPVPMRWYRPRMRKAVLVPALIGLVLIISGFTLAFTPMLWGVLGIEPSSQSLSFTKIHQVKAIDGATITLEAGYADSNQVIIGYTVSPADAQIAFQEFTLSTRQGVVLNRSNDMMLEAVQSDGNKSTHSLIFSGSGITGKPDRLDLRLHIVVGRATPETATKGTIDGILGTVNFDFTLPFHAARVATPNLKATSHGKTLTLERVTVSPAATRIVVQGLGDIHSMSGGLAGTLQVPWDWRSYDYGTAAPGADGPDAWSFVYPFDFSFKQGAWTLTIQQGIYTWVFHFDVPM